MGGREFGSGATYSRHPVHLMRALPDVCGHACVGGSGAHRVRDVERTAGEAADRMARAGAAGGHDASHHGGAAGGGRWTGTRTRRGDESAVRSQVPAMSTPGWVEHVIWWHAYPLGFVGAFPAAAPPEAHEHRLRHLVEWFDHAIELGAS